ncbi:MAG: hypothetical protein Q9208_007921 [Pyrenodesmia sp. 3 TL-2023]
MPLGPSIDFERTLIPLLSRCCTVVNVSDLRDRTDCSICTREFGWKAGAERPVQLRCGHIVGRVCIREWVRKSWPRIATCPECRGEFLDAGPGQVALPQRRPVPNPGRPDSDSDSGDELDSDPSPNAASNGEQSRRETGTSGASGLFAQAIERRRQALPAVVAGEPASSSRETRSGRTARPRNPRSANRPLSPEQKQWMRRTEHLWIDIYDAILDACNAQNAPVLTRYSSIYYMYANFKFGSEGKVQETVKDIGILEAQVPVAWSALMEHVDRAGSVGIRDEQLNGLETIPATRRRQLEERKEQLRARLGSSNIFG